MNFGNRDLETTQYHRFMIAFLNPKTKQHLRMVKAVVFHVTHKYVSMSIIHNKYFHFCTSKCKNENLEIIIRLLLVGLMQPGEYHNT